MEKIENIALESAAGSGKTRALTRQFLRLYLDDIGYPLKTLYGITFTNEVALEMKNRILRYLDLLATGLPRDESEQGILEYFRCLFPNVGERAAKKKRYLLHNLSDLNVSTFHSLFASFLSCIPFAAGVLPDYEIVDENEDKLIFEQVLDRFLETVPENDRLLKAVENLMAGEETGVKSILSTAYEDTLPWLEFLTGLVEDEAVISTRVEKGRSEFEDFLKKLKEFIEENAHAARTKTTGKMNKSLAGLLAKIESYLETQDLETIATIISKDDLTNVSYIKEFTNNLGPKAKEFLEIVSQGKRSQQEYFNALSNQKLVAHLFPILELHRQFQEEKQERNLLSFADIENYTLRAVKSNLESDYLYFKIGAEINHLLIDEFQDTSYLQLEILNPIITEITAVSPKEKSLFYVGDPRQAIFRWRGGSAELFSLLTERHPGKIKKDNLSKNYRSKEEIVNFVNAVIGTADQARPDNRGGWVQVETIGDVSDIETAREQVIARTSGLVKKLHDDLGYRYSDIAVLVRRNDFGAAVAHELARHNIPCLSKSKADIASSDDVRLVIQLLKFLDDPENDFALLHLLLSPVFNMKAETVRYLKGRGKTLYLALTKSHPDWPVTKKLRRLLDLVYFANPYELLYRIYEELELPVSYPLAILLDTAAGYAEKGFSSLCAFIDWLETTGPTIEIKESHPEGVTVLTVHKAKGLEFAIVILAETFYEPSWGENPKLVFSYAEDGVKPEKVYWRQFGKYNSQLMDAEKRRLENDEINLLYVAMTRAKTGLYILGCSKTTKEGPKPIGFWFEHLYKKVGKFEETIGTITPASKAAEERPEKTYGALVEKPITAKEERTLYSPTEREVEIIEPARRKGMEFGDLVHKALARIEWLDGVELEQAIEEVIGFIKDMFCRLPEDSALVYETLKPLLIETLTDPDLRFIFYKDGKGKKCKNELPLYFADKNRDVSTHIDRVIIEPEKIIIIDYKTGTEKSEYKEQMHIYKKGVQTVYPGRVVETALVFLEAKRGKKIVTVPLSTRES